MSWTDVHTHLNTLDRTPERALQDASAAGVARMITIGTAPNDHQIALDLAERLAPQVYCALGVHPHEAKLYTDDCETWMREKSTNPRVVALGEMGLDYHYDESPREVQRAVFRRQLALAVQCGLPVEIHTRDAEEDTITILSEFAGTVRGLLHCFTGTQWLAEKALGLGLNISISGVVTFKNAEQLRAVVREVPIDRLHLETDAPYLAPVPHRGQKNHPALLVHTALRVAEIKGLSLEELRRQTEINCERLFTKMAKTTRAD